MVCVVFVCVVCACGVVCGCVVLVCACGVVCACVLWCVCCVFCVVCLWVCGVLFFVCVYMWCWWSLARGKPPCVYVQNASVCTVRTSPCVRQQARMSKTFGPVAGTHGDVLTVHTEAFWTYTQGGFHLLFSSLVLSLFLHVSFFFFLLFSLSSFSPLSSLSSSLSAHTETRSDRQVTPPTMNGHAPRDPLNQERSYQSVNPCYVTFWEFFACWGKLGHKAPLLVGLDFHVQRFICADWVYTPPFSRDTVYRKTNDRKQFGRVSNPTHAAYCSMAHIHNTCNIHCLLSFLLDENILGKWFRSSTSRTKEGLFITGIFPARNLFFITVLI